MSNMASFYFTSSFYFSHKKGLHVFQINLDCYTCIIYIIMNTVLSERLKFETPFLIFNSVHVHI